MSDQLYNTREVADQLGTSHWRVRYVAKNRDHITPTMHVGNVPLFDATAIERIRREIKAIDDAKRPAIA